MLISFNFKNGLPACMSSKLDIFLLFDLSLSVGPIYLVEETRKLQFPPRDNTEEILCIYKLNKNVPRFRYNSFDFLKKDLVINTHNMYCREQ
jgi:hypothetical protein